MDVYRTPDERFENLPGYPYAPRYVHTPEGLRVHYVDEGSGDPVLCLHGEPTWSYLYRDVIDALAPHHRVVAPDFVGFGRSDKLTDPDAYSLELHVDTLAAVVDALDLSGVTLVVHDWGGLVGLTYAARHPERIARLVVLNTFLPVGSDDEKSKGFLSWRRFIERNPDFPVGKTVRRGLHDGSRLSDAEAAAYDAPFPTAESKAGAAVWPLLVPMTPDDPVAVAMQATRERLSDWQKPAFVLFAPDDPILGRGHAFFRDLLPTASDQPEVLLPEAGHFLQEEKAPEIAEHVHSFIERTA